MFQESTFILALATFLFFAGVAWEHFGTRPDWVRVVVGIASIILALSALFAPTLLGN